MLRDSFLDRAWALPLHVDRVLDLACGSGEVSLALAGFGVPVGQLVACDPYTYAAFESRTGRPCARHSFEDIAGGEDMGGYICVGSGVRVLVRKGPSQSGVARRRPPSTASTPPQGF